MNTLDLESQNKKTNRQDNHDISTISCISLGHYEETDQALTGERVNDYSEHLTIQGTH